MKNKRVFAAVFAAIVALSCSKDNVPEVIIDEPSQSNNGLKEMTFTAIADDALATRTSLDIDNLEVKWAASEGIYLFDGYAPRAFTSTNTEESTSVNFTGFAASSNKYYAVYPSGTFDASTSTITTSIPTFQTATVSSFAPKSNVAVAYAETTPTEENVLQFKNLGAVVRFKVSDSGITKVRLDALGDGMKLSGKMDVTYDADGNFTTSLIAEASESCIILNGPSAGLSPDQDYYFVIIPGNFQGGFKITLFKDNNTYKSFKNTDADSYNLQRNEIFDFGTIPEVKSWKSNPIDELTRVTTGITNGAGYSEWSASYSSNSSNGILSSATYKGISAGGYDSIQLRNSSSSGIVTTSSGGYVNTITIDWNSQTTSTSTRTVEIYGKNSAYTSSADLYDDTNKGTLITTFSRSNDPTTRIIPVENRFQYIGIKPTGGALYLNKATILWMTGSPTGSAPEDPTTVTPTLMLTDPSSSTIRLSDNLSAYFDVTSNVPWTVSVDNDSHDANSFASVNVSDNRVTVTFLALESGSRSATVTVTPDGGIPKSHTFTQKNASEYTATLSVTSHIVKDGDLKDDMNNTWILSSNGTYSGNETNCIHVGANSTSAKSITLTSSDFSSSGIAIKSINVWASSKANTNVSTKVYIGDTLIGSSSVYTENTSSAGGTKLSVSNSNNLSGNITVEVSRPSSTNGAIYFNKLEVVYDQ